MSKKKILFYYKLFFAGGTEHSILKLIKKLLVIVELVQTNKKMTLKNRLKT